MIKYKIGNDLRLDVSIFRRDGIPEDLSTATFVRVYLKQEGLPTEIEPPHQINGNMISLDFLAETQTNIGEYRLYIQYKKTNIFRSPPEDLYNKDVLAFELVQYDEEATSGDDYVVTLTALIEKNHDGRDGADNFQLWKTIPGNENKALEEFITYLQQPAIDAATTVQTAINNTNDATTAANTAAGLATGATAAANAAAGLANTAADTANTKAALADTKATAANAAAVLADAKAGLANTAAETATNAAAAVAPGVINNEQVQAEIYNVLNARITALEQIISNGIYGTAIFDKIEVVNEFNSNGTSNLFKLGTAAPAVAPDFIGQFYINTTAGVTYQAKGIVNSGDWKQISN